VSDREGLAGENPSDFVGGTEAEDCGTGGKLATGDQARLDWEDHQGGGGTDGLYALPAPVSGLAGEAAWK
jgi:hypothetical protein